MLAGICFLASQNLIHGAITCSNLLLSAEEVVKIGTYRLSCEFYFINTQNLANSEYCRRSSQKDVSEDTQTLGMISS